MPLPTPQAKAFIDCTPKELVQLILEGHSPEYAIIIRSGVDKLALVLREDEIKAISISPTEQLLSFGFDYYIEFDTKIFTMVTLPTDVRTGAIFITGPDMYLIHKPYRWGFADRGPQLLSLADGMSGDPALFYKVAKPFTIYNKWALKAGEKANPKADDTVVFSFELP